MMPGLHFQDPAHHLKRPVYAGKHHRQRKTAELRIEPVDP